MFRFEAFIVDHVTNLHILIFNRCLAFFNPESKTGFSVPYPTITLHATSRHTPDAATAATSTSATDGEQARACIYCQLDETEPEEWDTLAEEDMPETREMYIYPDNPAAGELELN